ncbi:MAG: GIY-YIG nuclease family protein [Planctomycetota bacterium]
MNQKRKTRRRTPRSLVLSHLRGIKRALLEGEKRLTFLEFLKQTDDRRGIYALYDSKGRLHYTGKASDLPKRLNQHLKDKHAESWDQMTLFFLSPSANVAELEGLIVATANPPGNTQRPRIGIDRRKELKRFLKKDAMAQIDQAIYPTKKEKADKLSGRITPKKLRSITQKKLATVLQITPGRVSQIIGAEPKKYTELRRYIREAGRRDAVLLLLQKERTA